MNIEQVFLDTKEVFAQQIQEAAQEALDKLYDEYLPHVESDTGFNVAQKARDIVIRYMADSLDEHDLTMLNLNVQMYGKELRKKMFQDNKEELTKAIGQDIIDRLKELEERHQHSWETCYA